MNPAAGLDNMGQLIALIGVIACLIVSCVPDSSDRNNLARNRRIFWAANCSALVFIALGTMPDWKRGIVTALGFGGLMIFGAAIHTPYVKIRGKIYAVQRSDRQAESAKEEAGPEHDPIPDSYTGSSTANQTWWMLIAVYLICMALIFDDFVGHRIHFTGIPATIIVVCTPLFAGYWDASWGYRVARGQRLQLAILSIMTVGIFAALYFPGFYAGKRWPRRPKRSMEYLVHPRHWTQDNGDNP